MKNKKELKQEYAKLVVRYNEEYKKFQELSSQLTPTSQLEVGKPIESPKRPSNTAAHKEIMQAEQKLDKLRQEVIEARNRLYEGRH